MDDVEVVVLSGPCAFEELPVAGVGDMDVDASVDVTLDSEALANDEAAVVLAAEVEESIGPSNILSRFWASQTAQMKTSAIKAQETFILNVT